MLTSKLAELGPMSEVLNVMAGLEVSFNSPMCWHSLAATFRNKVKEKVQQAMIIDWCSPEVSEI